MNITKFKKIYKIIYKIKKNLQNEIFLKFQNYIYLYILNICLYMQF